MKRSWVIGMLAALALAFGTLLGGGCVVSVRPAAPGLFYVGHRHVHSEWCGHYRAWADGYWVYYYDGRWEYYNPSYRSWVYYDRGREPAVLRGHVSAAKTYRVPGRAKGAAPAASKAPPAARKGSAAPAATKAPPPKKDDGPKKR